jgi:PIN like domain
MPATFFVDENDLALGKALAQQHDDVVYPGHPELPEVPRQTPDDEWLRIVGTRQLIVITRDQRIRYRPVEKLAWVTHQVRGFVLTGRGSQSTEQSLHVLIRHWSAMDDLINAEPVGPWMYAVTSTGLRPIALA